MWSSLFQFKKCFQFRKALQLNPISSLTQFLLRHKSYLRGFFLFYYYRLMFFKSLTFLFRHKATALFQDLASSTCLLYRQKNDKQEDEKTSQELPGQVPSYTVAKLDREIQLCGERFLFFPTQCCLCSALYSPIYAIIPKLLNHNDIIYLSGQIFF